VPELREERRPPRAASSDPFFDRPYEAGGAQAQPAWEAEARPVPARGSASIRPKRKVASLLGGGS
jgi:ATP-dependent RNA helicase RhlE